MRVISFGVPADDLYVFQPLKRISTVDLLSWLLYNKTWLQETGRHLSPVGGGGGGGWTIQMATMVINGATNMKIAAQKAASKCGVHSVVRLQKKWGTAIIPTLWFWCEADVDCRRRRWQIHLQPSWWCRRTSREPKTRFPLNFYLMAVLNYSVVLASALFCCLLTTPFEEKAFAFLLYISFEESVNYWVYSRVNNL